MHVPSVLLPAAISVWGHFGCSFPLHKAPTALRWNCLDRDRAPRASSRSQPEPQNSQRLPLALPAGGVEEMSVPSGDRTFSLRATSQLWLEVSGVKSLDPSRISTCFSHSFSNELWARICCLAQGCVAGTRQLDLPRFLSKKTARRRHHMEVLTALQGEMRHCSF